MRSHRPSLAVRLGAEVERELPRRLFAEIAVNSGYPSRQTFSYGIPRGMKVREGMAVYVPFGKLTLQGIVVEVHDTPTFSEPEKIRDVRSVIGDAPLIDAERLSLAGWIAREYLAPMFDSVALFLPPGFERKPQTIVHATDTGTAQALPSRLSEVLSYVTERGGSVPLDDLRGAMSFSNADSAVAALELRGCVMREYRLARPRIGPKSIPVATLAMPRAEALSRIGSSEPRKRSRRALILERLLRTDRIPVSEAAGLAGGRANLDRLARAGVIAVTEDAVTLAVTPSIAEEEVRALTFTKRALQGEAVARGLDERGEETLPQLREDLAVDMSTVRWLAELGVVTMTERAVARDPLADLRVAQRPAAHLLPAQEAAANTIGEALNEGRHEVFLLHGVTGSGKTEVYLDALDRCIATGRKGLVLVPEIALTPQTIRRFRERFSRVAVLHSGLSDGELFDQWEGIAAGKYDVVIGARSATFAPQPDLGLIVVDEEHEWTYKQQDPQPRYHARDVAIELARRKHATVVLGSATPDVGSYHRAASDGYTLLSLPQRVRPASSDGGQTAREASFAMPRIDVVDLRDELHAGNRSMFGRELHAAIEGALRKDEQVILFLNRRGLAGHVQCRDCGFVPQCGSCSVALTFHKQFDRLVCHQCNKRWRLPATCQQCGSPRVRLLGAGVEKVEVEAGRLFPHARLLRWDRDLTKARGSHARILSAFLAREADILIGTQMVSKGLDMPGVTVVGVINADTALHLPDFRAGERTFQLLTQVAGRAGRGEGPGHVIIQTYTPEHPAIEAAARYDYEGFVGAELETRQRAGYPPFGRLVQLTLTHPNPRWARDEALRLHRVLRHRRAELGSETDVVGPSPAYVPRVRGRWRWQVLLRGREPAALVRDLVLPPHWSIDVDPSSLV